MGQNTKNGVAQAFIDFYKSLIEASQAVHPLDVYWAYNGPVLSKHQ